jgi:hypothetical protein
MGSLHAAGRAGQAGPLETVNLESASLSDPEIAKALSVRQSVARTLERREVWSLDAKAG